jgi:protein-S-isoprenylcysteine O-methyltransferase Ste14
MHNGFIWILFTCAIYGFLHSLLASNAAKAFARRHIGQVAFQRFYRLFFVLVAAVTTLVPLALVPLLPDRIIYLIPAPWLYLSTAIQGLALIALLIGVLQTGALTFLGVKQLLETTPGRGIPEKLIVGGLYRWVRHPLYTAAFLILWLVPLMTWNLLALNLGFSAYLVIGTINEERKLVDQFGEAYEQYRQKTPRIIPGIKIT